MLLRFLTYIFVFFFYCTGFAQESPYLFQRLSVKDGLFEETVHTVQQDAKGFIWLNFRTLIQRYDGHRLINFYQGVQLPEGNVRAMAIDKKNRLWLLSGDASLGYLNPDNFMYHPVRVNIPKGYNSIITAMYLNRNNEIMLIWDKQGFVTYNDQTKTADQQNNLFVLPKGWEPMHLWQDEAFNFWAGSPNGLIKYNSIKKTISYRDHNEDNDPAITAFEKLRSINSVYVDHLKNHWIITWEGGLKILCYNSKKNKQTDWTPKFNAALKKYYVPYGFTETTGNDLWLTGSSLFCKLKTDEESLQVIPQHSSAEYSILYDMVFSVYEDREKNIWLGTNKGLFRFNPNGQFFTAFANRRIAAQSVETEVTDFMETKDGELLISTWGSGIFSYDMKMNPITSSNVFYKAAIEGSMAWSMIQRENGDVWCGMQAGAVYIFEAATKKFTNQSVPLAEGKTIRQLAQDKNGNIWLGTHGGAVIKWDVIKQTFSKLLQIDGIVSRVFVDKQNRVWVGTDRAGLYRLNSTDGNVQHHYTSSAPLHKKLLINGVTDILQYSDSVFYVAGNGLNIINTNTDSIEYFTVKTGLPSANISNLLKDKNGFIWMTSGSGIISYNPGSGRLSHYDANDGVPNFNFSTGAAAVLKNGTIVFGTNRDILFFNPESLSKRTYPTPDVHITGMEIMGRRKSVDSLTSLPVIELRHSENAFKVLLSTLRYKDIFVVYYKLEGIDKEWKQAGKMNVVEYNYLPPGDYIFKAACFNESGKPGKITTLSIKIAAPFYLRWWFFSAIALALTGLLIWIDRERMKRKEAIHKMRSNIAGKLHEDVNLALNNINILSEIARLKADTEPEKSKEFIEQIHKKSHHMMIAMDDMLWSISPENDSMEKTIERMREFIDAQMNRYAVHIELIIDERLKHLNLPMQLRHEAFLLFKESINGLLDAKADDIRIQMGLDKSSLLYMIECNNDHCDLEELNRFLNNRKLAEKLDGIRAKLDIHIQKSYAVVECRIPLEPA